MLATLCLLQCVLVTAQTPDGPSFGPPSPPVMQPVTGAGYRPRQSASRYSGGFSSPGSDWLLVPRLGRAQELVYRGSYAEETTGSGVQFQRSYRIENRVLVLDASPQSSEVAVLTVLRHRGANGAASAEGGLSSVRVEVIQVNTQGHLKAGPGVSLAIPLDGPPTLDCGIFVEVPCQRVGVDQTWETLEEGRPVCTWHVAGTELINATSCVKVVGVQESDDWERPRADRAGWRRQETIWIAPRVGIAYKVERVIERREAGRREAGHRTVLRYELESSLPYPRQLFEDRRDEVAKARLFAQSAAPLLTRPGRHGPQLDAVLARINHHLEHQAPTPYREAVLMVKRRVEAAKRGESPPTPPPSEEEAATVAVLGQTAPDFVATDLITGTTARLQKLSGRPVLMIFYSPTSVTAEEMLRFAQAVQEAHKDSVTVLGLAMSDDAERVREQRNTLKVTFPILNGSGLRQSYGVETTPKVVVLDESGTVRCSQLGWGEETPTTVLVELRRCLQPPK